MLVLELSCFGGDSLSPGTKLRCSAEFKRWGARKFRRSRRSVKPRALPVDAVRTRPCHLVWWGLWKVMDMDYSYGNIWKPISTNQQVQYVSDAVYCFYHTPLGVRTRSKPRSGVLIVQVSLQDISSSSQGWAVAMLVCAEFHSAAS